MRSALFISANTPSMLQTAHAYDTQAFFYDLEDSVAPQDKRSARFLLSEHLTHHPPHKPVYVRINPYGDEAYAEDIVLLKRLNHTKVLLPKVTLETLKRLVKDLKGAEVIALLETPEVFFDCLAIAKHPQVVALMLGGEDLALALDSPKPTHPDALFFARSQLLYAAKAAHKFALDTPYTHFQDMEGLKEHADIAWRMGFDGKVAIHPAQLPIIEARFSPSQEALDEARAIVEIHQQTQSSRFSYQGKMVDQPILKKAYKLLGLKEGE